MDTISIPEPYPNGYETCLGFDLLALVLHALYLCLDALAEPSQYYDFFLQDAFAHFLFDKLQPPVDGHDSFCLILLQEYRSDLLVDVRLVIEKVELLNHKG
jgi:hypothetical protein